jgi:nucleoside-diphosphate-sugar epimerase
MEMYEAVCVAAGASGTEPEILARAPGEIHDQWLSAEKARTRLGWKASVDLASGLARTVDWYRAFLAR